MQLQAVAEGGDPAADKTAARKATREPAADRPVEHVVHNFIERHAKEKTREATWRESKRIFEREIAARWRGKPLSVIRKSDIHARLDAIMDRGKPAAALQAIRPMFKWAVQRSTIASSPCEVVDAPSEPRERDRWLTDDELQAVWSASSSLGYPFGPIIQLLILHGQRRDEVGPFYRIWASRWALPLNVSAENAGRAVPYPEVDTYKGCRVMLMPGVGLDVVPSDCVAAHVAARLPDATRLRLSIGGLTRASRGTAKTMVEGTARHPRALEWPH